MANLKSYTLHNKKNCLMATFRASSYKEAREFFASLYQGEYSLAWYQNEKPLSKNVRFK